MNTEERMLVFCGIWFVGVFVFMFILQLCKEPIMESTLLSIMWPAIVSFGIPMVLLMGVAIFGQWCRKKCIKEGKCS